MKRPPVGKGFAAYEKWVTWYSTRLFPAIFITSWFAGLLSQLTVKDPLWRERLFQGAGSVAVFSFAAWMFLTGVGILWIMPSFLRREERPRKLLDLLLLAALLATGFVFLGTGAVLGRGFFLNLLKLLQVDQ